MEIAERKEELLKYSAREVRNNRSLFAEFIFIYESEGGRENCKSCAFQRIFTQWKRLNENPIKKNTVQMKNTFKLANEKEQIAIPFTGKVITKDSPDEMVNEFLSQEGGKHREARTKRFFAQVPKEAKKAVEKKEQPKDDIVEEKAVSKKPSKAKKVGGKK